MVENGVLAGDYQGYRIDNNEIQLPLRESCRVQKEIEALGFRTVRSDSFIPLNKDFIQSYRLIDSIDDIQKDVFSALFRGGVGQMIFGNPGGVGGATIGGVGGATIAKNRNDGYKIVDVQFRNGKRSLLRLDLKAWEVFLAESYCSPDYEPKPIVRPKLTKTFQIARSILALAMVIGIVWLVVRCTM